MNREGKKQRKGNAGQAIWSDHKNVVSDPHCSDMSVIVGGERGRDCLLLLSVGGRCELK